MCCLCHISQVSQLVIGIEWGFWSTVLWFGVNFMHHQRKNTGHCARPLAIRTHFQLGQIHSLLYGGRRVNVSLGLGLFLLVLCYWSSGQPVFTPSNRSQRDLQINSDFGWFQRDPHPDPRGHGSETGPASGSPSCQRLRPHHPNVPSLTSEEAPSSDLRGSLKDTLPGEPGPGTHIHTPRQRSVWGRQLSGMHLWVQRPYWGD